MPSAGFEPTISAGQLLLTYNLDRVDTGTGLKCISAYYFSHILPYAFSETIRYLTYPSDLQHISYCQKVTKSALRYSTALFTVILHVNFMGM